MKKKEVNSPRVPIYRDSGFELYDAAKTASSFEHEILLEREPDLYIYSRYRNPTVVAAEEEIMKIEDSKWAILTQSGMSAIDIAVSIFQNGKNTRPWLFFTEIYGGTLSYIDSVLKRRRGLNIRNFTADEGYYNLNEFENVLKSIEPEFVYLETISNPMLIVADVTKVINIAKKHGSKIIVDNTFATPYLYKPLEYGADLVIHSATKYLSGHGNLTAGVICGNDDELMRSAIEYRKFVGHMLSPDDAYRLHSHVMSFEIRFSRQCVNATCLASLLDAVSIVKKVHFPGLKEHPTYKEAVRLFGNKGSGAIITFDFDGENADDKRRRRDSFIKLVSGKIKLIPTLGDARTILMPIESVWRAKYPEPGMIRLSVGFERYSDLKETVENALHAMER